MTGSRPYGILVLAILSVSIFIFFSPISEASSKHILVGLVSNKASLNISSTSSYILKDSKGKRITLKSNLVITSKGTQGMVNIKNDIFHLPLSISGKGFLVFNNTKYRGTLRIIQGNHGLNVINLLEMEDYLRGVLKMEVNPNWPFEALKAQAIISRTYAFRHMGRHSKDGYDLCNLPHCQVYRGVNAEDPLLDRAVKETRGLVVTFNGGIALTPFHSDSGGATADVRTVWGRQIPYLKATKEPFDYVSPYSSWSTTLKTSDIQKALGNIGVNLGTVRDLEAVQHNPFGRVDMLKISGTRGTKTLSSHSFRMAIGSKTIKSTMFNISHGNSSMNSSAGKQRTDINQQSPAPRLSFVDEGSPELSMEEERLMIVLTKQGFFNAEQMIDMLLHPEKRKSYLVNALNREPGKAKNTQRLPIASASDFILKGKGWGHGVGLSQWGAKSLAEKGWKNDQIISHYYPGTKIEKYY